METNSQPTLDVKTNFFRAIAALKINGNLNLTIRQLTDGNLVVSTRLVNERVGDNARNVISPLNLTTTASELDEIYFKTISAPIKKTSGLLTNMEAHLKSINEANRKSRMEQDKNKKGEKSKSDDAKTMAENQEAYKQLMGKSLEFEKDMKYKEALEVLPNVEDYPKYAAEITKKRKDLEAKSKLATMF